MDETKFKYTYNQVAKLWLQLQALEDDKIKLLRMEQIVNGLEEEPKISEEMQNKLKEEEHKNTRMHCVLLANRTMSWLKSVGLKLQDRLYLDTLISRHSNGECWLELDSSGTKKALLIMMRS